jgi:hypothetical protein
LEVLECVGHLWFVHDGIFAQIREHYKRPCDTLPTGPGSRTSLCYFPQKSVSPLM